MGPDGRTDDATRNRLDETAAKIEAGARIDPDIMQPLVSTLIGETRAAIASTERTTGAFTGPAAGATLGATGAAPSSKMFHGTQPSSLPERHTRSPDSGSTITSTPCARSP